MKVVGYVRVSTKDQAEDGESLARQVAKIRAYCDYHGLELIEIIHDDGVSGFKWTRPGFQRLMDMCRNRSCDMVVVYDLSRLSRSLKDTLTFMSDYVQSGIVHFVTLSENIDTSSAMGKAHLALIAVFNQLYRDEISQKTKAALDFNKKEGKRYSGSLPYGFTQAENGLLVHSEADGYTVCLVRALRQDGLSLRAIGKELERRGLKTKKGLSHWNAKTIRALIDADSKLTQPPV